MNNKINNNKLEEFIFLDGYSLDTPQNKKKAFAEAKRRIDEINLKKEAKELLLESFTPVRYEGNVFYNRSPYEVSIVLYQGKTLAGDVPPGWQEQTGVLVGGTNIPPNAARRGRVPSNIKVQADYVECSCEYKDGNTYKTYDFEPQESDTPIEISRFRFTKQS